MEASLVYRTEAIGRILWMYSGTLHNECAVVILLKEAVLSLLPR